MPEQKRHSPVYAVLYFVLALPWLFLAYALADAAGWQSDYQFTVSAVVLTIGLTVIPFIGRWERLHGRFRAGFIAGLLAFPAAFVVGLLLEHAFAPRDKPWVYIPFFFWMSMAWLPPIGMILGVLLEEAVSAGDGTDDPLLWRRIGFAFLKWAAVLLLCFSGWLVKGSVGLLEEARKARLQARWSRLDKLAREGPEEELDRWLQDDPDLREVYGRGALRAAAKAGNKATVRVLEKHGVKMGPLEAVYLEDPALLSNLLKEEQAKEAKRGKEIQEALVTAVREGKVDLVPLILEFSTKWEATVALPSAMSHGQTATARKLLEHGADPDERYGSRKATALWRRAEEGNLEMVKLLLEHGADPNIPDISKKTPLDVAVRRRRVEVEKVLRERGAKTWEELKRDPATPSKYKYW